MAEKVKEYTKLPGSKKGFLIGKYTLWQGADHLLHIFSRVGIEDYKRFYFDDIQAIIVRKTLTGKVQNIILGCLMLLFLFPAFKFDGGWSVFYIVVVSILFLILLVNLLLGPTCDTRLMTAVQTEKLQSLHRLYKAFRVMDQIGQHIQQVQGSLSREDLSQIPGTPAGRRTTSGKSGISPNQAGKPDNGRAHLILFALLLLNGVLVISEFFISHVVPTLLSTVTGFSIGIFVIIALVRQHNSDLPGSLRIITWTTLGYVCVAFGMGYIVGMVFALKNPSLAYNQWELIKAISRLSPWDNSLMLSYNILVLGGAFSLGIPGLIIHRQIGSRGGRSAPPGTNSARPTAGYRAPQTGKAIED